MLPLRLGLSSSSLRGALTAPDDSNLGFEDRGRSERLEALLCTSSATPGSLDNEVSVFEVELLLPLPLNETIAGLAE